MGARICRSTSCTRTRAGLSHPPCGEAKEQFRVRAARDRALLTGGRVPAWCPTEQVGPHRDRPARAHHSRRAHRARGARPAVARRLLGARTRRAARVSPDEQRRQRCLESLSARERDVLVLLSRSLSNAEIAADAGTTDGTVKGDVTNIPAELDAATRVRAATITYRAGLDRDAEQP
ncbi:response regulator transcription factor [Streptomyces sp. NPDC090052]|uniref:helix-turn-helix transcriptional regulator n=1 Tax=Streptomyces sp. NPDC090052 TaxID=3365931 RepID=UPI00381F220E